MSTDSKEFDGSPLHLIEKKISKFKFLFMYFINLMEIECQREFARKDQDSTILQTKI